MSRRGVAAAAAPVEVGKVEEKEERSGGVQKTRVAILGASGYTGAEVMRLLGGSAAEYFSIEAATAETHAGKVRSFVDYQFL